jgi:hypothetical protein
VMAIFAGKIAPILLAESAPQERSPFSAKQCELVRPVLGLMRFSAKQCDFLSQPSWLVRISAKPHAVVNRTRHVTDVYKTPAAFSKHRARQRVPL